MSRTPEQVKSDLAERGLSITDWALFNGYSPGLVYQVLSGKRQAVRGKSHQIAVALGIKAGKKPDIRELQKQWEQEVSSA